MVSAQPGLKTTRSEHKIRNKVETMPNGALSSSKSRNLEHKIRGVLRSTDWIVLPLISKHKSCLEFNEAGMLAILTVLRIFATSFHSNLVLESDSRNAISWIYSLAKPPWRFQFFNEIRVLSFAIFVEFHHVGWSATGFANSLAKQGVDTSLLFVALNYIISLATFVFVPFFGVGIMVLYLFLPLSFFFGCFFCL